MEGDYMLLSDHREVLHAIVAHSEKRLKMIHTFQGTVFPLTGHLKGGVRT